MKSVMLVANARAGSVSARVKEVITKALQADFKVEVADTRARNHAAELARDAADRAFDAVLVFGGDGTINEAAQGIVESDTALGILPGGTTNVMARSLGIPSDPVEATAFVAAHLRSGTSRLINVGRLDERYFLFSAGMGLDAEVVRRVEADPDGKRKYGDWLWLSHALRAASHDYANEDPSIVLDLPDRASTRVCFVVCCNARPFTYFKQFPVDVCPRASLDKGLDLFALARFHTPTIARIIWALFVSRAHIGWRNAVYGHDLEGATLTSNRPFPVQVDGDFIGDRTGAELVLVRDALEVLV